MAKSSAVGFVGLGNMGWRMAGNLCKAGVPVIGLDANVETMSGFAKTFGAMAANGPEAFAGIDCLITMLPHGGAVKDVLLGTDDEPGALSHLPAEALVIDMSSADPAVYSEITPHLHAHDHRLIDAPVSGNISGAEAGTLTIMAGGDKADVDRARPLFEVMGKTVFHTGELGSGQAMKALNNLASAAGLMVTIEVLLTAQRFGLDPKLVNQILNVSTGRNNSTERKIEPFVLNRAFNSGFGLALMAKDLRTAQAIAERTQTTAPLSGLAVDLAQRASAALGDGADHTAVAQWIEDQVGEKLKAS